MEVQKIVEDAWLKTIEDFKNAEKNGETGLWTEASLRLNFIRHLNEVAKLGRVLAETPFHFGNDDYKPDLIADVMVNNEPETVVFEMKFYGQTKNWKKDLEKLEKYYFVGWDYGYFLAIGNPEQCDEIQKEPIGKSLKGYEIRVLTQSIPMPAVVPNFRFAELVLRKVLGKETHYVANEWYQQACAFYEKYALVFDMTSKENKFVVWAELDESLEEQKVKELGYTYISFDEKGHIHPSKTFTDKMLLDEFEVSKGMTVNQMVKKVKEPINQFIGKIDNLDC